MGTNPFEPKLGKGSSSFISTTSTIISSFEVREFKARGSAPPLEILNKQSFAKEPGEIHNKERDFMQSEEVLVSVPIREVMSTKLSKSGSSKISNASLLDRKQVISIKLVLASISNLSLKRIDPTRRSKGSEQGEDGAQTMQTDSSEEQIGCLDSPTNEMLIEAEGYARAVGFTTSVAARLWALRDGINLCIALKISTVIFELDAQLVVNLLKKSDNHPNGIGALISNCKVGLQEIPMVQVQHCYREANKCADSLARRGALLPQDFVIFLDPPSEVLFLLNLDAAGMYSDRFVSVA
nr:putative ribonuclease h protein [Quercus suber]